jgi:hypothetical protein
MVPPDAYDHDASISNEPGLPTQEEGKLIAYEFAVVLTVAVTPVLALHAAVLAGLVVTAPTNCPATRLSVAPHD